MNSLIQNIDELIEERSLLKHPFYQMWSDGKLSLESLKGYAKEYFQIVKSVPSFMTPIINQAPASLRDELKSNQEEEIEHIKPWMRFATALGVDSEQLENYHGLPKTRKAISHLSSLMNSFEYGSCAMYAFEKEIPKISQIKLEGLAKFYGISDKQATEYFKLHTEADIRHTASWKKALEQYSSKNEDLLQIAEKSISAQNMLLDSCYESYC
ncbi:MAG TPA: iron-containing redox enzyme family protein [Nitrosopumilaceae archaeon]|nr:iron-containing redox enzyme family protein [Nitrosopumilaceae archaeon]